MVGWICGKKERTEAFVESTNVEELRSRRVWQFLVVTWLTWILNGIYFLSRGYQQAAVICLADSMAHLVIVVSFWNHAKYRHIMNLNLLASGIGLFLVSISDQALAATMLYYPISILVASQVVGVRSAFFWLVFDLTAFVLFYAVAYGFHDTLYTWRFDEFVLVVTCPRFLYQGL